MMHCGKRMSLKANPNPNPNPNPNLEAVDDALREAHVLEG